MRCAVSNGASSSSRRAISPSPAYPDREALIPRGEGEPASSPRQLPAIRFVHQWQILLVPAYVAGDVGAERHHGEAMRRRVVERRARQLGRDAVAFERRWHFRVRENDAVARALILGERHLTGNLRLVALRILVIPDRDRIQA